MGRSFFNWLLANQEESDAVQPWCKADYRVYRDERLFEELTQLGISLNKEEFLLHAECVDTPEDLQEYLWLQDPDEEGEMYAYLLIFELWRRLLPHKRSISIVFDDMDHLIMDFDLGQLLEEERVVKLFQELRDLLDLGADAGTSPKEILPSLAAYSAHDVEGFLRDYLAEELEEGHEALCSEWIDAFFPYMQDQKWFSLLKACLLSSTDPEKADLLFHQLQEEGEGDEAFLEELKAVSFHKG